MLELVFQGMIGNIDTRGVWRIGRRRLRRQTGGFFPIGALAGPIIGGTGFNLTGPLFKKIVGGKRSLRRRR